MNIITTKLKSALASTPLPALLLFLTGFFFSQFMLINILFTKHPFGGWETSLGSISNQSIFVSILLILSLCLIALWKVLPKSSKSNATCMDNVIAPIELV